LSFLFSSFLTISRFPCRVDWATPRASDVPKATQQSYQYQQQQPSNMIAQFPNMIPSSDSTTSTVKVDHRKTCQIHFSFIAKHNQSFVNESTIRTLFEGFGPVADVAVKKTTYDPQTTLQNGYGFVHFPLTLEGINTAVVATRNIHHVTINRIKYDSCLTRSLEEIIRQLQSGVAIEEIVNAYSNGRIHNDQQQVQHQRNQPHYPQQQQPPRRFFNEERENNQFNKYFSTPAPAVAPLAPSSSQISLKETSQWLFNAPSPSPTSVSNDLRASHSRSSSFSSTGGSFSFSGVSNRDSFNSHASSSESISEELYPTDEGFTMNLQNVLDSVLN
jgi:hypothetical protein